MAKEYQCSACKNEVDRAATICSNPACRVELAFCSHCRDVSTYSLVEKADSRFVRDKYQCGRCQRVGVKCYTWLAGGYCNGLARVTDGSGPLHLGKPLCAWCMGRVGEVSRSVVGWSLIGALGGLLRPRR